MTDRENMLLFVATIQAESKKTPPHLTARACLRIMRNARRLKTLAENLCNIANYQEQYDKKKEAPRRAILAECKALGLKGALFGGDPRGAVVKLQLPSGKTDDWGAEGFCVPGA